jgi:hypothetical protein
MIELAFGVLCQPLHEAKAPISGWVA